MRNFSSIIISKTQNLLFLIILSLNADFSFADKVVGALSGELGVSPSGGVSYSIPISVAPGVGGMQPNLSLNYGSQVGSGPLGHGWGVGGLSYIKRCGSDQLRDGVIDPVDYDENDALCLNGGRLIQVIGDGVTDGAEFVLETNGALRVVAYGDGPSYFKVHSSNGNTSFYGGDSDGGGSDSKGYSTWENGGVSSWALKEERDRFGNRVIYNYHADGQVGGGLIDTIQYGEYEVKFIYGSSGDSVIGAYEPGGYKFVLDKRLERIVNYSSHAVEGVSYN